jgi:polyribonucleotide nucleotidyltransferase
MIFREKVTIGEKDITIETGRMARQADGSVLISTGQTYLLVTVVSKHEKSDSLGFIPLTVDYLEKTFAAGRIPGGFYKREGKPTDSETITSRLIDRSLRPLFPEGYMYETQLIATVLSHDQQNEPDILALTGGGIALLLSDIPFEEPVAGVRVGHIGGHFVLNPMSSELEYSDLNLVMACTENDIVMVEGEAESASVELIHEALRFGHDSVKPLLELQRLMMERVGVKKRNFEGEHHPQELLEDIKEAMIPEIANALGVASKRERREALNNVKSMCMERFNKSHELTEQLIDGVLESVVREYMRDKILNEGIRIDGRKPDDIRPVFCEVGVLPRTHGSALFTRGETQAIVTTTLGTSQDEQKIEALTGESYKSFLLHYNFPPFCVGEAKPLRAPSRREIGHGALAERALKNIIPPSDVFPYTIRVVSEILESNGSSSMATVCGGSLSLMDAGVPISSPVAGIAMGLVSSGDGGVVLTDIMGDEDHVGDMDLKVTATASGITAIQMDLKTKGISTTLLKSALQKAVDSCMTILLKMNQAIERPRSQLSAYAPRIITMKIKPEKIKDLIGPGGTIIKKITGQTGSNIDIEEDGTLHIASPDEESSKKVVSMINELTREVEVGMTYLGKVIAVKDFGAFVEIFPGKEGLVHISELSDTRVRRTSDVLREGDEVLVKVIGIDRYGRIKLSRRAALGG